MDKISTLIPGMSIKRLIVLGTEFYRYFIASALALGVDFGFYIGLVEWLHFHYLWAAAIGFCAGVSAAYILSIFWVFKQRAFRHWKQEFALFLGIGIVGLLLNELILWLFTGKIGLDYRFSKAISAGVVFLFNFTARKFLLFSQKG